MEKEKRCLPDAFLFTPTTAQCFPCARSTPNIFGGLCGSSPCTSYRKYIHVGCPAAPELPEEGAHWDEASRPSPESSLGGPEVRGP